jgi:hypothetical protein
MKMSWVSPRSLEITSRMNTPMSALVGVNSIWMPLAFSMMDQSLSCDVVTP